MTLAELVVAVALVALLLPPQLVISGAGEVPFTVSDGSGEVSFAVSVAMADAPIVASAGDPAALDVASSPAGDDPFTVKEL